MTTEIMAPELQLVRNNIATLSKQLCLDKQEINAALAKIGTTVNHNKLYLRRLQTTFDIMVRHYDMFTIRQQATQAIQDFLSLHNCTPSLLCQNLLRLKNSTCKEILLLQELRQHVGQPIGFSLTVEQPTYLQKLQFDDLFSLDSIFEVVASFQFSTETSSGQLRKLISEQLPLTQQKQATMCFLLSDQIPILNEFWHRLAKMPSTEIYKDLYSVTFTQFQKLAGIESTLLQQYATNLECARRLDRELFRVPPLTSDYAKQTYTKRRFRWRAPTFQEPDDEQVAELDEQIQKAKSAKIVRRPMLRRPTQNIRLQQFMSQDAIGEQILMLQIELKLSLEEQKYAKEILDDHIDKRHQYLNRLKTARDCIQTTQQLLRDRIQIRKNIQLQQFSSSKMLLELVVQLRNSTVLLFHQALLFQQNIGAPVDFSFNAQSVLQPLIEDFTDNLFVSLLEASGYPAKNMEEMKQLFGQHKARIVFGYVLPDKLHAFPELFWFNILRSIPDKEKAKLATDVETDELIKMAEMESKRIAEHKQVVERARLNHAMLCKIPVSSNQVEVYSHEDVKEEVKLALPETVQFNEPSSEHSSDAEEIGQKEVNIQTDYAEECPENRSQLKIKLKKEQQTVFDGVKDALTRSKSTIKTKSDIWDAEAEDDKKDSFEYKEALQQIQSTAGRRLTRLDFVPTSQFLRPKFSRTSGQRSKDEGQKKKTKKDDKTVKVKKTFDLGVEHIRRLQMEMNQFKDIQVQYEIDEDKNMTPLQKLQMQKMMIEAQRTLKQKEIENAKTMSIFQMTTKEEKTLEEISKIKAQKIETKKQELLIQQEQERLQQLQALHDLRLQREAEERERRMKEEEERLKEEEMKKLEIPDEQPNPMLLSLGQMIQRKIDLITQQRQEEEHQAERAQQEQEEAAKKLAEEEELKRKEFEQLKASELEKMRQDAEHFKEKENERLRLKLSMTQKALVQEDLKAEGIEEAGEQKVEEEIEEVEETRELSQRSVERIPILELPSNLIATRITLQQPPQQLGRLMDPEVDLSHNTKGIKSTGQVRELPRIIPAIGSKMVSQDLPREPPKKIEQQAIKIVEATKQQDQPLEKTFKSELNPTSVSTNRVPQSVHFDMRDDVKPVVVEDVEEVEDIEEIEEANELENEEDEQEEEFEAENPEEEFEEGEEREYFENDELGEEQEEQDDEKELDDVDE